MIKKWKSIGACVVCACGVMTAMSDTFCWKPGSAYTTTFSDFGNSENWLIPDPNGSNPNGLVPGPEDSIYGAREASMNLEGKTWTVKNWISQVDWNKHSPYMSNGTLVVTGNFIVRAYQTVLRSGTTLSFPSGSLLNGGEGSAANHYMQVDKGALLDVRGTLKPYNDYIGIMPGGMAVIDPEDFRLSPTTRQTANTIYVQGKALFPHGLVWNGGGGSSDAAFKILLRGGTIVAAGDFSRNGYTGKFNVTLEDIPSGGTFEATDDVTFSGVDSATVQSSMSFLVHDGATLDMTPFTFAAAAKPCYKVGKGTLRLGASLPPGLIISDGTVALTSPFSGLPGFSFLNSGVKLRVEAAGSRLDSIEVPTQKANLSFECGFDLSELELDTPFFSSTDADILLCAKTGFMESCPAGRMISIVDGSLVCVSSGFRMLLR